MDQVSQKDDLEDVINQLRKRLNRHLESQLRLCDVLEEIADSLPNEINTQRCLTTAFSIYPVVRTAHEFEERELFPVLEDHVTDTDWINPIVERLKSEHWEDESFGEEIAEALRDAVAGEKTVMDRLGYMLRGFFEGMRRHVAFEREFILPLLSTDRLA